MNLEVFLADLSKQFKDEEEALFRLDSIIYLASEAGLPDTHVQAQAHFAGAVATQYQDQIAALKLIEKMYDRALQDPNSALSKYVTACRTQLQINVDETKNPMRQLAGLTHSGLNSEQLEKELKTCLFGPGS